MKIQHGLKALLISILVMTASGLLAAGVDFLDIQSIIVKPRDRIKVLPYALNLESSREIIRKNSIQHLNKLGSNLVYVAKVKVNNKTYYRLVSGNYNSQKQAQKQLARIKKYYPGAWINTRSIKEREKLSAFLLAGRKITARPKKAAPASVIKPKLKKALAVKSLSPEKLIQQAKQEFLQGNYSRVLAITSKISQTGSNLQKQQALELAGIARERQKQFAQAIAIYNEFLATYPESPLADKIKSRLAGLKTMRIEPRARLTSKNQRPDEPAWNFSGAFSQYYRDDVIDRENEPTEEVNSALVTDVNFFARRKTERDALQLRFDGGVVNDFLEKDDDSRISRALIQYTSNESGYQLTAGRQNRTAKGVYGRFDGLVYKGLSHSSFSYSLYTGYPVQSSFDDVDTTLQFLGTSINFGIGDHIEMDLYLLQQNVSDLTDRQAIGTEFQYRTDRGFLYGIIDYDVFFNELNNLTAISNIRVNQNWVLNITYDHRFSPLLSTSNALQGQSVTSIEELQNLLSKQEIFQLAEEKTSKSQNLFVGSSYQIDLNHQLYLSLSLSAIDKTIDIPASDDTHIAGDYTIKGYFIDNDYTTFGFRLSDTSSSEIVSLRSRTRLPGARNLRYDPRLNLDYRNSKNSDISQWILKPSFEINYKPTRKLSLEFSIGLEYSNFDLPEANEQTAYNVFIGYVYQF